jgi:hypothetical protein
MFKNAQVWISERAIRKGALSPSEAFDQICFMITFFRRITDPEIVHEIISEEGLLNYRDKPGQIDFEALVGIIRDSVNHIKSRNIDLLKARDRNTLKKGIHIKTLSTMKEIIETLTEQYAFFLNAAILNAVYPKSGDFSLVHKSLAESAHFSGVFLADLMHKLGLLKIIPYENALITPVEWSLSLRKLSSQDFLNAARNGSLGDQLKNTIKETF